MSENPSRRPVPRSSKPEDIERCLGIARSLSEAEMRTFVEEVAHIPSLFNMIISCLINDELRPR